MSKTVYFWTTVNSSNNSGEVNYFYYSRQCCGGHGYSLASGIPQVIQEADAGSTYEGDNVVMLLQTARYLLKYAQTNTSPHLALHDMDRVKSSPFYKRFERLFSIHYRLYDEYNWSEEHGVIILDFDGT